MFKVFYSFRFAQITHVRHSLSKLVSALISCSFPFSLKPCGFSLPGGFTIPSPRREQVPKGRRGKRKEYGIPNLAQIAEGCRTLSVQPSETPFAAGTALRIFVSENQRKARRQVVTIEKKIPMLAHRDSRELKTNNLPVYEKQNTIKSELQKTSPHRRHPCRV